MRNLFVFMLLCLIATISSCQNAEKKAASDRMSVKFEWSPAAGSSEFYPMEIYHCDFIFADGSKIGPEMREVSTVWGDNGGTSVIGDVLKPVPVALDICWLSFTENKFYSGRFELPYALISQQFKNGFEDYSWTSDTERHLAHHSYDFINVGMAPGGIVVYGSAGQAYKLRSGDSRLMKQL